MSWLKEAMQDDLVGSQKPFSISLLPFSIEMPRRPQDSLIRADLRATSVLIRVAALSRSVEVKQWDITLSEAGEQAVNPADQS